MGPGPFTNQNNGEVTVNDEASDSDYFGSCPVCDGNDGYLNLGPAHWFVCDTHKTKWCWGSNLGSSWKSETEADWQHNYEKLRDYTEVRTIDEEESTDF